MTTMADFIENHIEIKYTGASYYRLAGVSVDGDQVDYHDGDSSEGGDMDMDGYYCDHCTEHFSGNIIDHINEYHEEEGLVTDLATSTPTMKVSISKDVMNE